MGMAQLAPSPKPKKVGGHIVLALGGPCLMGKARMRQAGQGRVLAEPLDCARGSGVICRAWVRFTAGRQLCLAQNASLPHCHGQQPLSRSFHLSSQTRNENSMTMPA